uniref:Esterase n=1 Tax=Rhizomucor miehei TaxID=4839 RepID=V5J5W4_RHIMI|nr:esterase [Rhizomucor miehei]
MTVGNPPIHPVYAAAFAAMKERPPIHTLDLKVVRESSEARQLAANIKLPEVIEEDKVVESDGKTLKLTIVRPPGTEDQILPVLIFLHGGGFVFGSKYTHIKPVRDLTVKANVVTVFVDYSLSPEAKFPTAIEEIYAAILWVRENASSLNINAEALAVAGDSAGATLSAAVSIYAKEKGLSAAIKTQVLIYPATAVSHAKYESYKLFGNGDYILSAEDLKFFSNAYLPAPASELNDKLATLELATKADLEGLPPALLFTAESDVLRDEGEKYAQQLAEAGVDVAAVRVLGAVHGFITVPVETPQYRFTINTIVAHLRDIYAKYNA